MVLSKIRIPIEDDSVGLILSVYECEVEDVTSDDIKLSEERVEAKWFSPREASKLLAFKYPAEFTQKIANLV